MYNGRISGAAREFLSALQIISYTRFSSSLIHKAITTFWALGMPVSRVWLHCLSMGGDIGKRKKQQQYSRNMICPIYFSNYRQPNEAKINWCLLIVVMNSYLSFNSNNISFKLQANFHRVNHWVKEQKYPGLVGVSN